MARNPWLQSGNVGCLGNLRWLKDPSTSEVTACINPLHTWLVIPRTPLLSMERENAGVGGCRGRGKATVHLASPACLFPLGVEREILSSLLICWCLSSHHGKLMQIYLAADLQGFRSASVPGPKCLSGHLDKAQGSRCGENPGSTVQDSNKTPKASCLIRLLWLAGLWWPWNNTVKKCCGSSWLQ